MKCIHCSGDTRYRDRSSGRCATCHKRFAFEPKRGDIITDAGFKSAIDAVSAAGRLRWDVEHLYYEVCRRTRSRFLAAWSPTLGFLVLLLVVLVVVAVKEPGPISWGLLALLGLITAAAIYRRLRPGWTVAVRWEQFKTMWDRWVDVHGRPDGLIERKTPAPRRRPVEPDVGDYSFDRAVICDRPRTVDLLLANNFHFENNCAVLAVNGYPEGPFDTVLTMLKRNPRLEVFALHDASPSGCRLATDVGLRPAHAGPFRGLCQPAEATVAPGDGVTTVEAEWLSRRTLELAAIRPEQVLKRLSRAIHRQADGEGVGVSPGGDGSTVDVEYDSDSFGSDARAGDGGGGDGFG
jgi:hypothetical protein